MSSEKLVSLEVVESASDSAFDTAGEIEAETVDVVTVAEVAEGEAVATLMLGAVVDPDPEPVGDFALDGTKGTEAGFKLDLIEIGPVVVVRLGSGLS